jgi:hypothetical protein
MKYLIFLIVVYLAGCSNPYSNYVKPEVVHQFDMQKLRAIDKYVLCQDYYTMNKQEQLTSISKKQFQTVLKENGLTDKELEMINERKIFIGMSQCGLYASWGKPTKENKSVNRWSIRIQHIYGYNRNYVYTENGLITSWQN